MFRPTLRARYAVGVVLATAVLFDLYEAVGHMLGRPFQPDYTDYFVAARIGLANGWSHIYDFDLQRRLLAETIPGWEWLPFWNPPPLAWLAAPFASLPFWPGFLLWVVALLGAWFATWRLLAPTASRWTHLLLLAGLFPVANGIWLGQPTGLVALGLAGAWWLQRDGRHLLAGVTLAAALSLKPHPLILVPVCLLVAGAYRTVLYTALTGFLVASFALLTLGPGGLGDLTAALVAAAHSERWAPYTIAGLVGFGVEATMIKAVFVASALSVAYLWRRTAPSVAILAGVAGSLAVAPYLHLHDLAFLVPAAWIAAPDLTGVAWRRLAIFGWLAIELSLGAGQLVILLEAAILGLALWQVLGGRAPAASSHDGHLALIAPASGNVSPSPESASFGGAPH